MIMVAEHWFYGYGLDSIKIWIETTFQTHIYEDTEEAQEIYKEHDMTPWWDNEHEPNKATVKNTGFSLTTSGGRLVMCSF